MAYGNFCPGPAHILKPHAPPYNPENTYDEYKNAFPPEFMNLPVMGAWVPVEYRPDDIIVIRRNPYYWKVDEAGNQLPYLNEVHYRLRPGTIATCGRLPARPTSPTWNSRRTTSRP